MAGLLTGPASGGLSGFFVPGACLVIVFLGYTSQWLFNTAENLEPGPMTNRETCIFNILLACLWCTYYRACTVPPGRYDFSPPKTSGDKNSHSPDDETKPGGDDDDDDDNTEPDNPTPSTEPTHLPTPKTKTTRWCKKCAAPKPLRAHHCRHCGTCIPKMDHHCPWTANCVSLQTFPYFLRFLTYVNLSVLYLLSYLLYPRFRSLFWDNSRLPSYLGPSVPAMVHLVLLGISACLAEIAMGILLITTVRGWVLNQTMIEGWEMERHEAVLLRRNKGGWWDGGNVKIERVEFPYDISFFANMAQAMGTKNVLSWFDPFVGGGPILSKEVGKGVGWEWEENGFNDREGMWPPPDPQKVARAAAGSGAWPGSAAAHAEEAELVDKKWANPAEEVAAFRARQEMDLRRRKGLSGIIAELEEDEEVQDLDYEYVDSDSASGGHDEEDDDDEEDATGQESRGRDYYEHGADGEPGWTNAEGDRLRDYGVDEDAEDEDEDIPLGELLRRRKAYGIDDA